MSISLSRKPFIASLFLFLVALTAGPAARAQSTRTQSTQAQSTFPHTLLWRISGNGLQKPSYLYGTMHLNDKRLFRFDDSVYRAIEKTEGLAIEVNPDEMAAYFVNQLFDQIENGKKLQDLLDQRYFNRNRNALAYLRNDIRAVSSHLGPIDFIETDIDANLRDVGDIQKR